MRCERLQELLPAYIGGDLPGRQNQQVSDHLDGCEACRCELSAQQRALRALDAGRHTVSIDLWAEFSRRLQAQSPPPPPFWRTLWQPGLAVASAAVAVAFIAGLAVPPGPGRSLQSTAPAPVKIASAAAPSDLLVSHAPPGVVPVRRSLLAPIRTTRSGHTSALASRELPVRPRAERRPRSDRHPASAFSPPAATQRPGDETLQMALMPAHPDLMADPAPNPIVSVRAERSESTRSASAGAERDDRAMTHPSVRRTQSTHPRTGDPLRIAMALAVVEQDTASDQVGGELFRMAREVARVGGESVGGTSRDVGSAVQATDLSPDNDPSGT